MVRRVCLSWPKAELIVSTVSVGQSLPSRSPQSAEFTSLTDGKTRLRLSWGRNNVDKHDEHVRQFAKVQQVPVSSATY